MQTSNTGKLQEKHRQFLLKLIKAGNTRDGCIVAFKKKFGRSVSYESIRRIARSANLSMAANTGHLTDRENAFIDKMIRDGLTQNESRRKFISAFGRTISSDVLRRRAIKMGLRYAGNAKGFYNKDEISILKGAILLGKNASQSATDIVKNKTWSRGSSAIRHKIIKLKTEGAVSDSVKMEITKAIKAGKSNRELAKKHGINIKYIEEFRNGTVKKSQVEIQDLKRWEDADINKVMDQIEATQEGLLRLDSEQSEANINITTKNKYVALMFLSDIHLENVNTDLSALRRDIDIIKNTQDFYVGFGGDLIDNFMVGPHKEGAIEAVIPPKAARIVAGKLLDRLKGRLLWSILGCHDAWDKTYADYCLPEHIARKMGIPYLGHGGDINITFKNGKKATTYQIHARHKYRGSGGDNGTACCKNVLRNIDSKYDIVAISHNHFAEIKIEHFLRKERVFIRTGSYKREDGYSKMLGFEKNDFNSKIPVVIMNSETREMRVVSGVKTASDTLKALNGKR